MGLSPLLVLLTIGGTLFAFRSPTEEELVASFGEAQRFYAEGAYDQAIERYEEVSRVRSRILDAERIEVTVGEDRYPVQEASAYQVGNAQGKLHADHSRFAVEARTAARREQYRILADSAFAGATRAFERVIAEATSEALRGQAHGRLVELYFEAGRYDEVIEASARLLEEYEGQPFAAVGHYNRGWAYFELGQYPQAIAAFEALVAGHPTGYRADRSLFQIGESLMAMEEYERAIGHYQRLVERQRIEQLSEAELLSMKREKLAGLVDETALELAAKAEIQVGTCYARLARYDEGIRAYRRVITLFRSERQLVEEAYLRMADLYEDKGDIEGSVTTYREAIDESSERTLKGRIQYALAERLFGQGRYEDAVSEYRVYARGYGDIALSTGFPIARVRYRIGSAYQQLGQTHLETGGRTEAHRLLAMAIAQYDSLQEDDASPYRVDARYNRALALQMGGNDVGLGRAEEEYRALLADEGAESYRERSMLQLAEVQFTRGEYTKAARQARELLEEYPDTELADQAHLRLGLALQLAGESAAEAIDAFLAVPPRSPLLARAKLGAGHALLTGGRHNEAIEQLSLGLAACEAPQKASFHYLIGQSHLGIRAYDASIHHFSMALESNPDPSLEEGLHLSRGNAAFLVEDFSLGEEDFSWVVDHVEDLERLAYARDALAMSYLKQKREGAAIEVLDDMLAAAKSPEERAGLLARMMDLYYDRDQYEQTVQLARRLLALDFAEVRVAGRPYGLKEKAAFLIGDCLLRQQQGAAASAAMEEFLEQYPTSYFATNTRLNLATHHFAQGELEAAKVVFERLRQEDLQPEQAFTVGYYLANTNYSLREFRAAREDFAELLANHPNVPELPDILFGLGESLYQTGEFQDAVAVYRRVLAESPDDPAADDAQYNLAWCQIELGQEGEAMTSFGGLVQRYPDSEYVPSAQFTFGDYAYNQGRYREAIEAYSSVVREHPDAPVAAQVPRLLAELNEAVAYQEYEVALALMDSAEATKDNTYFERAVDVFQKVRKEYPNTESEVGSLSNMGVCLEGLGRWRDAVQMYDQVIELYEDKRAAQEAFHFAKAHRDWIVSTRL